MKKILIFFAVCMVTLCLAACNESSGSATQNGSAGENVGKIEDKADKKEPVKKNYPDNILMADRQNVTSKSPVFGNENVKRQDIQTVTFKDTLADMPADAWDVSDAKNGSVMAWVADGVNLYIAGEGGVTAKDCSRMFLYYINAVSIDFGGCFYTDISPNLYEMFARCEKLESLDLSGWNTSGAESITCMFYYCSRMKSLNLSGWDTSNVAGMKSAFHGCRNLEAVDVSHFDTSKVTSFESVFWGCEKLSALDVSKWNTASVKKMTGMFSGCENLTALDLSGWDTSRVESMYSMFEYSTKLASVGDFKIPEGCDTTDMFKGTPLA